MVNIFLNKKHSVKKLLTGYKLDGTRGKMIYFVITTALQIT